MLVAGNKILISHRRLFKNDEPRYFLGEVVDYDRGIVKVMGYSFIWDVTGGTFLKKKEPRMKLISLSAGTVFAYQLPDQTETTHAEFVSEGAGIKLTDHAGLEIDMAEWPARSHV